MKSARIYIFRTLASSSEAHRVRQQTNHSGIWREDKKCQFEGSQRGCRDLFCAFQHAVLVHLAVACIRAAGLLVGVHPPSWGHGVGRV